MSDPTNTGGQHPSLVTVSGRSEPAQAPATNTDDQHPAIVTRPGGPTPPAR
jgi:hypothetical protein